MMGILLLIFGSLTGPASAADSIAGSVKIVQGGAVVRRGPQTIPATSGMHLLVNDILQASSDGRLGAILQDGTGIGMGPDTELTIDNFVFEPADGPELSREVLWPDPRLSR
jgi:hypothetical protein